MNHAVQVTTIAPQDSRTLTELFRAAWPDALRYAAALCRRTPEVDPRDLCQEAAVVVCEKYWWLTDTDAFAPVFITTIRNRHWGLRRDRGRRRERQEKWDEREEERRGGHNLAAVLESTLQLRHGLLRLSPQERQAWKLSMRGASLEEMCAAAECTRECMKKRLGRMRKKLRETLEGDGAHTAIRGAGGRIEQDVSELFEELHTSLIGGFLPGIDRSGSVPGSHRAPSSN